MTVVNGGTPVIFDPNVVSGMTRSRICGSLFSSDPTATVADTYGTDSFRSVCCELTKHS